MTEPAGWDFQAAWAELREHRRLHLFDRALARVESDDAALEAARRDVEARALAREREEAHRAAQGAGAGFGATLRDELRAGLVDVTLDARGRVVRGEG